MNIFLCVLIVFIVGFAIYKKVDIMSAFSEGVKEGAMTVFRILSTLLIMLTAISAVRASGMLDLIVKIISPAASLVGIPPQTVPLIVMRPFSGSGTIALLEDTLSQYGADSIIGKTAAVMAASTETTFYTVGVYLGGLTDRCGKIILCAVIADIVSYIMSAITVNLFSFQIF